MQHIGKSLACGVASPKVENTTSRLLTAPKYHSELRLFIRDRHCISCGPHGVGVPDLSSLTNVAPTSRYYVLRQEPRFECSTGRESAGCAAPPSGFATHPSTWRDGIDGSSSPRANSALLLALPTLSCTTGETSSRSHCMGGKMKMLSKNKEHCGVTLPDLTMPHSISCRGGDVKGKNQRGLANVSLATISAMGTSL